MIVRTCYTDRAINRRLEWLDRVVRGFKPEIAAFYNAFVWDVVTQRK